MNSLFGCWQDEVAGHLFRRREEIPFDVQTGLEVYCGQVQKRGHNVQRRGFHIEQRGVYRVVILASPWTPTLLMW